MKPKSIVQIRTVTGLVDVPCFHQWKLNIGGVEFEFALHPKAGRIKGLQRPLAISELGTGYDVKAVLLHPNSRNRLTENSAASMSSDAVRRLARASLHHLIFKKVGAMNFLQAMVVAQMSVASLSMDMSKLKEFEVTAKGDPAQLSPGTEAVTWDCAACKGSRVLTTTDKDHEGQPIETACTECIPGGVGFRFDAAMTPGDPAAGGDGVHGDEYIPSPKEMAEALEDADRMNSNMREYGTIDVPTAEQLRERRGQLQERADQHGTMTGDTTEGEYGEICEEIDDLTQKIHDLENPPCSTTK
jgi:hypothetical protein